MAKCRAFACGCEVTIAGLYCDHCEEFTPICPCCGAVYGEHRLDCEVADNWEDLGEGPWDTEDAARDFGDAEVGISWEVRRGGDGKYWILVRRLDD